jgi:hypothetical protein
MAPPPAAQIGQILVDRRPPNNRREGSGKFFGNQAPEWAPEAAAEIAELAAERADTAGADIPAQARILHHAAGTQE